MKKLILIILVALSFASCEKLLMPDPEGTSPNEVFENLWRTIDEGYINFSEKSLDWDSIYAEYQPRIFDTMTDEQLFDTCAEMLALLEEPYINFRTPFSEYNYVDFKPYKENFNRYLMERNYWRGAEKTGPFIHTIIDSVGYVYYGDFDQEINESQLDIIINKYRFDNDSLKGFIFDIRNNSGGDIENAFTLLKRMGLDTTYTITNVIYKTIYKDGKEKDNLSDAQTAYLEQSTKTKFPKRFILLTNRYVTGTAALFTSGASSYSNVRIYGDTTGGGVGRVVGHELPNGWRVTYPASISLTDDDRNIELGIAPDRQIDIDPADENNGKDTILEEAIRDLLQ